MENNSSRGEYDLVKSQILGEMKRQSDEKAQGYSYYFEHFEEFFRFI